MMERAAFLVAADLGGYRCRLWPYHRAVQREVFRGRIPPRTIAVLHTHPNSIPRPSTEDRLESRRLGLSFIVVSARHIYAVTRTGEVAAVVENEWWSDGMERTQTGRCEPFEQRRRPGGRDVRRAATAAHERVTDSASLAANLKLSGGGVHDWLGPARGERP